MFHAAATAGAVVRIMDPQQLEKLRLRSEARRRRGATPWIIFGLVLLLTAGALYFAWPRASDRQRVHGGGEAARRGVASAASVTNPPPAAPIAGDSNVVLTVSGYIVNRERIELSPRFMGVVKWMGVKKGDSVTNGQVVVLLDDAEQSARVREGEARVAAARTALAKAELDHRRMRELIEKRVETQANEDDARLRVESARATLAEAEATLEMLRTHLGWTVIRSPIDGVVLEKLADANELVTPQSFGGGRGPSTAVLAIADPKDLQVEIDLSEADVAKAALGQSCRVTPEAYPDRHYEGYVAEMSPEANRQKGTLQVKVQIKNPDKFLTPELTAKVDFLKDRPQ